MTESNKPEINLEICSGFFRIPTADAIYNITVLAPEASSVTRVVEKIVSQEKPNLQPPPAAVGADLGTDDEFYKVVSADLYHDIGKLAKSLSSTIMELPAEDRRGKRAELDEAGEKIEHAKNQLKDIVSMTEKATMEIMDQVEKVQEQSNGIKDLLSALKNHGAFGTPEEVEAAGEAGGPKADEIVAKLREDMARAKELLDGIRATSEAGGEAKKTPSKKKAAPKKKTRHLFPLDVVFQTMYELCTNETVKSHITTAREQAATIFSTDVFHDQMSEKIVGLEVDSDNFFLVPLTAIFRSLHAACSDDKTKNLFQRMEKNKDTIFLDQNLPLEAPPTEEVVEAVPEVEEPEEPVVEVAPDPRLGELDGLLGGGLGLLDELENVPPSSQQNESAFSCMTPEDQAEIFRQIEEAFGKSSDICVDVSRITETLSFQDLSGQQIMKIIKLLSDFQVQLLGIVVSFGSQLKHKEENRQLTLEETKRLAQEDVDAYLRRMTGDVGAEEEGSLDQETVNKLLSEMGF